MTEIHARNAQTGVCHRLVVTEVDGVVMTDVYVVEEGGEVLLETRPATPRERRALERDETRAERLRDAEDLAAVRANREARLARIAELPGGLDLLEELIDRGVVEPARARAAGWRPQRRPRPGRVEGDGVHALELPEATVDPLSGARGIPVLIHGRTEHLALIPRPEEE